MTNRKLWVARGAAVALFAASAHPSGAQAFVGPTRQYAASGCATGVVAITPSDQLIRGTLVCAQGTGVLGYTQLSGLTLLTFQLNLAFTPGPDVLPTARPYDTGVRAGIQYAGAGCTTGVVCTGLAIGSSSSKPLEFFPAVPFVGSVDLAAVSFTELKVFFDYLVPPPDSTSSSTTMNLQLAAVPEPSTLALTVSGLAVCAAVVRRRTRAAS